ncbi:hypothetical protein [Alkalihalophilus marmarensis]|uniref:hypothetical protein n=1 Tax=Alkalihalophilus marmarensis TaxID=521377 RepID=UPI002DBDE06E|nr:hypothetical protein [Alkalihalophilus marmarensis]MEC2074447.1 hypothetical protein [Alkalihalophilus marmarensis]
MENYLDSVDFALRSYYESIQHYQSEIIKTNQQLWEANYKINTAEKQLSLGELDPDENFPFGYIDHFFGMKAKGWSQSQEATMMKEKLKIQQESFNQLSGSILQLAKQGLSYTYGDPSLWPTSPLIGSQAISKVIRIARNQSMHYEDGKPSKQTQECFELLEKELAISFDLTKNQGGVVVFQILHWSDHSTFRKVMLNLK